MKKWFGKFVICMLVAFNMIETAQATNSYKVYNKNENKSYYVTLGTVKFISNEYYVFAMFKDKKPYCILDGDLNRKDQLVGGRCTEINAANKYYVPNSNFDVSPYEYGFREVTPNTFLSEATAIKATKSRLGYTLATKNQLEKINEY